MELTTYDYFINYVGYEMSPADFKRLLTRATKKINFFTYNRIKEINDDIQNCACEIVDLLRKNEELQKTNGIQSETVGPHTITYSSNGAKDDKQINNDAYNICKEFLNADLMFRG